ncbi:MAG: SDR family oxidoreductase [Rhodospirillaceae bacterium]|jgi:NAD(P)-dependent dehydrogenase (short-subunit alcohol dehydrogenase family)|nr:SDR family oxidoreductase [Rhodospirillaceae bacterium]
MSLTNAIDLSGRRILLTGAAGGIGAATARACAALGVKELILADNGPLEKIGDELRSLDVAVMTHRCDLSQRKDNAELIAMAGDLDAAVACAGICPLEEDWLDDPDWDDVFHRVMDVNLLGPIHLCRELLPRMARRGGGQIVLIGSIGGRMGGTSPIVQPHYIASKGGVHALIWWLAQRAAPQGVLVNGIAPGPIATAMTSTTNYPKDRYPLGRIGEPEEIAWPAAFLCSPAASYFSGSILDVNGGLFVG